MLQNSQTWQISTPPPKSLYSPHSRPAITPAMSLGSGLLAQVCHIINSLRTPTSDSTKTQNLHPLEKRMIEDLNQQLLDIREGQLNMAKHNTTLQHHAAKVEAAAAKLADIAPAEVVRERCRWEAERARLEVRVEKIRKELEKLRACAEEGWAERETLDKELEKMIEEAIRAIREVARVRVESERTGAEDGVTSDLAKKKQETVRLLRELQMTKERAKMHNNDFKPMPETDRLGVESEILSVEVDVLVLSMTDGNWENAARD